MADPEQEHRERVEQERKDKLEAEREYFREMKKQRFIFEAAMGTVENMMTRSERITDPMTRHLIFLDKLALVFDGTLAAGEAFVNNQLEDPEMIDDYKSRMKKLITQIKNEMNELTEWIQRTDRGSKVKS